MDTSGSDRTAAMFDALAPTYDNVGVEFFGPIAGGLVRAMAPSRGERWWDVGCGPGAVVAQVAPLLGPGGSVLASDISPAMVARAAAQPGGPGWAAVECFVDDAQDPDATRGPVDAVSACLVLFFLPAPEAAAARWRGLLVPGGRVGVTTFAEQDEGWRRIDALFAPYLPAAMRDARTSGARGPFASDAGMEELLAGAGYDDISTVVDEVGVRFADPDHWHAFSWSTGQRAMWLAVPEDERPGIRAAAEAILAESADPDGSVTLAQSVRHTVGHRPATG